MGWKTLKDELPPENTWVIGKRGHHRPFVFRLVYEKGLYAVSWSAVYLDVDNNYRDPYKWVEIPEYE